MNYKIKFLLPVYALMLIISTSHAAANNHFGDLLSKTDDANKYRKLQSSQLVRCNNNGVITEIDLSQDTAVDVIVQLKNPAALSLKKNSRSSSMMQINAEQSSVEAQIQDIYNNMATQYTNVTLQTPKIKFRYQRCFNGIALTVPRCMLNEIQKLDKVRNLYYDKEVKAIEQSGSGAPNLTDLHKRTDLSGNNIIIGILDTGIDYTNPALGGGMGKDYKVIGGYDFINLDTDPIDDHGHGTHVAGIAAGVGDDWHGVAPAAKLMAFKVLDVNGSGSYSTLIAGIEAAVDPDDDPATDDAVDVINMSMGGSGSPDDPLCQAVNNAVKMGVICVVAAGNDGMNGYQSVGSPASADYAITVGACELESMQLAYFSSKGPTANNEHIKPDVLAPGLNIKSSVLNWQVDIMSGTSMASPYIAGIAALLVQAHPDWSPQDIKSIICGTAREIENYVYEQGCGIIDFTKAQKTNTTLSPSELGLGITDFSNANFTTGKYFTLKNFNPNTQNYSITLRHNLDLNINVSLEKTALALEPGASDSVLFTMSFNPNNVPQFSSFPSNFEGWIDITSENDTLSMPFSLLHIPTLKVTFSELPMEMRIIKIPKNREDNFSQSFYAIDSDLSLNLPTGLYYLLTTFKTTDKLTFVIKKIAVPDTGYVSISPAEAIYKCGFYNVPNIEEFDMMNTWSMFALDFEGLGFNITYSYEVIGSNIVYFSKVEQAEEFFVSCQGMAMNDNKIYYDAVENNAVDDNLSIIIDENSMKYIDYHINPPAYLPDNLDLLNLRYSIVDPDQYSVYEEYTDYPLYVPYDPAIAYRIYYYPQPENTFYRLKLELAHTPGGMVAYGNPPTDDTVWHSGAIAFHENSISIVHIENDQGFIKYLPMAENYNYFGPGIAPAFPKKQIALNGKFLEIPLNEFYYQAGDYYVNSSNTINSYQLYYQSELYKSGSLNKSRLTLGTEGLYKAIVVYKDVITLGEATGDIQLTTQFDNTESDSTPPNIANFQLLTNNTLINPDIQPENVVAKVQFSDDDELAQVGMQCRASGSGAWIDLATTNVDGWFQAELDESLFANNVDLNLTAVDKTGNMTEYAMLPAFINQAATRISNLVISPELVHPAEEITLTAKIMDRDGITGVSALFKNTAGELLGTVTLFDDGAHNDGASGDNVYSATWIAPDAEIDVSVDFKVIDHLGAEQTFSQITHFTTHLTPVLKLNANEMTCKPGKALGDITIVNTGNAAATNIGIQVKGRTTKIFDSEYEIDSILPNETAAFNVNIATPSVFIEKDTCHLKVVLSYNNIETSELLDVAIKGTYINELGVKPKNNVPGGKIVLDVTGYDYNGFKESKIIIYNAKNNTIVDSLILTQTGSGNIYTTFQGEWTTLPEPADYKIRTSVENNLGYIDIDSTSLAFTTKSFSIKDNEILLLGNSQFDSSLTVFQNLCKQSGQPTVLWDFYYREDCDYMKLDDCRIKDFTIWRPSAESINTAEITPDYLLRYKIKRFLDKGGNILVTGAGFIEKLSRFDNSILSQYFCASYIKSSTNVTQLTGDSSDEIFSGITLNIKQGAQVEFLKLKKNATPILTDAQGNIAGVVVARNDYKAVLLGFDITDIADTQGQLAILQKCKDWLTGSASNIANTGALPKEFAILPNYPNPFNPTTSIQYQLPEASRTTIKIYDLLGREVATLLDNNLMQAGTHSIKWSGTDKTGRKTSSGIYLCRFTAGNYKSVIKMTLIK